MTWTLAVLRQRFQRLIDQSDISFSDVEAEQTKSTSRTSTDTVEKLQRLADNVVVGLVSLRPQVVLSTHRTASTKITP